MLRWTLVILLTGCVTGAVIIPDDGSLADPQDTDVDPDDDLLADADGDGFAADVDCDDEDPTTYPGAPELCDLVDHDCNGQPVGERVCPCDLLEVSGEQLYVGCDDLLSFDDAVAFCDEASMQLIVADEPRERQVVSGLAATTNRPLVWLGLTDRAREGDFEWLDGTPLQGSGDWVRGEPNDFFGEDCVAYEGGRGGWNDIGCETPAGFICESLQVP